MLSFKITGIHQKLYDFYLVSHWINWIVKTLKLKLFLLVYFFLTVKFLKNINIFLRIFFSYLFICINFFSLFNN